jgi:NADPH:quinone reductase-like Zn-dependent oxidoreductase/malonyl CoA-acyl carrier protein transacylase/acyl carrier protein
MHNIDNIKDDLTKEALTKNLSRSFQQFPIGAPTQDRAIDIVRNIDDIFFDEINNEEYLALIESAWRSARGPSRWIITARNAKEMQQSLADFVLKGRCSASGTRHNASREVTFVFSGMGPQWGGMGRELATEVPQFVNHIMNIDALFIKYSGSSVWDELYQYKDAKQLPTDLAQTGNFLIQAALYHLLLDENIVPKAILGHSAGEVAAAYAAGVYNLDEAVRVAITRGKLQASLAGRGSMLAAGLSRAEAVKLLADMQGVSIAAINDDQGVTLSGNTDQIDKIDQILQKEQIFSKLLRVEVPYHSPVMDEITHKITTELSFLKPREAKVKLYSTVTGELSDGPEWDADYWACNIRQPVLFADALNFALSDGNNCFVEIAPHPVLSQSIATLSADYSSISIHHLLSRRESEYDTFVTRISELAIDSIGRPHKGPSTPLLRPVIEPQQLWDEDPEIESVRRGELAVPDLPLLGRRISGTALRFDVEISTNDFPWLTGHSVQDLGAIVPATLWAELIAMAVSEGDLACVHLTDLKIVQSLPVSEQPVIVSTKIEEGLAKCYSRPVGKTNTWTLHAVASASLLSQKTVKPISSISLCPSGTQVDSETLYSTFRLKGLNYESHFKNLIDITIGKELEAWTTIDGKEDFTAGLHSPWVLDAGLQLLIAAAKDWSEMMYLPYRIGKVTLHRTFVGSDEYKAHARISVRSESELIGNVNFYDSDGNILAVFEEITCLRNYSDDAERLNYIDRNSYQLRDLTPEDIAERFYDEEDFGDESQTLTDDNDHVIQDEADQDEVALEEYWITDPQEPLLFDRPVIEIDSIDDQCQSNLLWVVPNNDVQSDVNETVAFLQIIGKLNIRTLTLTLIAKRGQAWVSGMRRAAANAFGISIRTIFIDELTSLEMLEAVVSLTDEHEIVFEGDEPLLRRLETLSSEQLRLPDNTSLDSEQNQIPESTLSFQFARGQLNKLVIFREPLRELKEGEVCVEVDTTSVTWKDIGKVFGTIGAHIINTHTGQHIGTGAAGTVIATGPGAPLSVGDRVYGSTDRSYRKHLIFDATKAKHNLRRVPEGVDNTVITTHMVPWITVLTAFENAKPKPGDKVFIQSGAGGLGSLLCRYVSRLGVQLVTSVGSEDKIDEVKKIVPDALVVVARGDAIPVSLSQAGHDSFDWVVSAVTGATRSSLMARVNLLGHYIDIGKPGSVDETLLTSTFDGCKNYFMVDVDQLLGRVDGWVPLMMDKVIKILVDPANHVPITSYSIDRLPDALSSMARGETSGMIAIKLQPDFNPSALNTPSQSLDPEGSYLITGGYGAVGLICAQWLSSRGARHIVLSGSSGKPNTTSQKSINLLRAGDVDVQIVKTDTTDQHSVMNLVRTACADGRKICGVIHAAGITADNQFEDIDSKQIAKSFGPKLEGAYNLIEALDAADALEHLQFVLFTSSVSSVVGMSVQGTYASANAGLDGLAEELRSIGINATSMQMAPIESEGMASNDFSHRYLSAVGLGYLSPRRLCGILDLAVTSNVAHFLTEEIDWSKNGRVLTANPSSSLLKHIVQKAISGTGEADIQYLLSLDQAERNDILTKMLLGIITSALGVEDNYLNGDSNFSAMGVDSLSIMEVQAGVNDALQIDLPLARMFNQDSTINQLAVQLSEYLEENHQQLEETA